MSNKRTTRILVILLIVTNIITFGLTNVLTLQFNNKVILPKRSMKNYIQLIKIFLKSYILNP